MSDQEAAFEAAMKRMGLKARVSLLEDKLRQSRDQVKMLCDVLGVVRLPLSLEGYERCVSRIDAALASIPLGDMK